MKLLQLLALCAALSVQAGPIQNMQASCDYVMNLGSCRVALDPADYPNATIPIILPSGVRRINKATYLAIRATGFAKDAQGRWLMCTGVQQACSAWDSDACVAYRSLFRQ